MNSIQRYQLLFSTATILVFLALIACGGGQLQQSGRPSDMTQFMAQLWH